MYMYKRELTTTAASDCGAERQTPDHSVLLPDLRSNKENKGYFYCMMIPTIGCSMHV